MAKRLSVLGFWLALTVLVATLSCREASAGESARQVADAIIQAFGGMEKAREFDNTPCINQAKIKEFSTLSGAANELDGTIIAKADKLRIEMKVMGQNVITGYDGRICWLKQGDMVYPADELTSKRFKEEGDHGLRLLLRIGDAKVKLKLGAPKVIDGHDCDALIMTPEDGKPSTFYADKKTHLIARSEFMGADLEQGLDALKRIDYSDYRSVLDTMTPFQSVEYTGDKKTTETTILSVTPDPTLPDTTFAMPAEKPIAELQKGLPGIPFQLLANEILIPIKVNGDQELHCIVDTGATQSILEPDAAAKLGVTDEAEYSITTGAGSVPTKCIVVPKLEIGELALSNVSFAVPNRATLGQLGLSKADGLIGGNVLRRFALTIDYANKRLTLQDPLKVEVPPGAYVIPTKPSLGIYGLQVEGTIDGKLKLPFLFDSGAAFNNVSERLVKNILRAPLLPVGAVQGLDAHRVTTSSIKFKSLSIGGLTVENPVFSVAFTPGKGDSNPAGIIAGASLAILGNPYFQGLKLTIDYRNSRLIVEYPQSKRENDAIMSALDKAKRQYYRNKNIQQAIDEIARLAEKAKSKGFTSSEALCRCELARMLGRTYATRHDAGARGKREQELTTARELAQKSGDNALISKVMAESVVALLASSDFVDVMKDAREMLFKAAGADVSQPELAVATGMLLMKGGKDTAAMKMFDQALLSDPSNWDALWNKHKLSAKVGQPGDQALVAQQLKYYYPSIPDVMALKSK